MSLPLAGGADRGASRRGAVVQRTAGPWTPAVHLLLAHLARRSFVGAPRPDRVTEDGIDEVSFLPGDTVGTARPWPAWVHTDAALVDVACWLRRYHDVVADFSPPPDLPWREVHAASGPDVVIAHNDAAPYNAVWTEGGLVGFVDWDMAGPRLRDDDVIWTAFSWVPLHARQVVAAEGFVDFDRRRGRLARFLEAYGTALTVDQSLARLAVLLERQVDLMRRRAVQGDASYARMIGAGGLDDLVTARHELASV